MTGYAAETGGAPTPASAPTASVTEALAPAPALPAHDGAGALSSSGGALAPADAAALAALTLCAPVASAAPSGTRTRAERRAAQHNSKYKTEMCLKWIDRGGACPYGAKCQFAHGPEELRLRELKPTYKSRPCQAFLSTGTCPYSSRCKYFHGDDDEERLLSLQEELMQRRAGDDSAPRSPVSPRSPAAGAGAGAQAAEGGHARASSAGVTRPRLPPQQLARSNLASPTAHAGLEAQRPLLSAPPPPAGPPPPGASSVPYARSEELALARGATGYAAAPHPIPFQPPFMPMPPAMSAAAAAAALLARSQAELAAAMAAVHAHALAAGHGSLFVAPLPPPTPPPPRPLPPPRPPPSASPPARPPAARAEPSARARPAAAPVELSRTVSMEADSKNALTFGDGGGDANGGGDGDAQGARAFAPSAAAPLAAPLFAADAGVADGAPRSAPPPLPPAPLPHAPPPSQPPAAQAPATPPFCARAASATAEELIVMLSRTRSMIVDEVEAAVGGADSSNETLPGGSAGAGGKGGGARTPPQIERSFSIKGVSAIYGGALPAEAALGPPQVSRVESEIVLTVADVYKHALEDPREAQEAAQTASGLKSLKSAARIEERLACVLLDDEAASLEILVDPTRPTAL